VRAFSLWSDRAKQDVPRTLNIDLGGEGSPTDRLSKRNRSELAERDQRIRATSKAAGKHTDGSELIQRLGHRLRRLAARPV
jgi:hypothetical protein